MSFRQQQIRKTELASSTAKKVTTVQRRHGTSQLAEAGGDVAAVEVGGTVRKMPPEVGDRLHCAPAYRMASGLLPGGSAASWVLGEPADAAGIPKQTCGCSGKSGRRGFPSRIRENLSNLKALLGWTLRKLVPHPQLLLQEEVKSRDISRCDLRMQTPPRVWGLLLRRQRGCRQGLADPSHQRQYAAGPGCV